MNEKTLVSVIVPVYNAGTYLEECLESIINQTYINIELLLVDDGSTDGSSEVCDWYAKTDPRVCVIHQPNIGAALARKNGVQRAAGEYICFVDADDRVDKGMITFFVENIGECDLITSGCRCENLPNQYNERVDAFEEGIYDTKEAMEYLISNMIIYRNRYEDGLLPFLINKMYKTSIVKEAVTDIEPSIVYAEDRDLLFRCVLKAKAIRVTHKNFYDYRYRETSIMRKENMRFMCDLNGLYLSLAKVFEQHPMRESLIHQLQLFITSRIYSITYFMGFGADTGMFKYIFPYSDLDRESSIVLYGAGKVGLDYYRQIHRRKLSELVLWVDKEWEKYRKDYLPVSAPDEIESCAFDYLIIAVRRKDLADKIRQELVDMEIAAEKILWNAPAIL